MSIAIVQDIETIQMSSDIRLYKKSVLLCVCVIEYCTAVRKNKVMYFIGN